MSRRCRTLRFAAALSVIAAGALQAQDSTRTRAVSASPPAPLARVIGVVFDSIAMRPLGGATVQLVASDDPSRIRSVTTDTRGTFGIDSVRLGVYLLGAFHARFDSLGLESPLLRVQVRAGDEIRAPIGLPSAHTLIRRLCGTTAEGGAPSLFMGFVRSARGEPLPGPAQVRAQWFEMTIGAGRIDRRTPSRVVPTSADGAFAICGIPTNGPITARAFVGADSSGFVELQARPDGLLFRDLYVGGATRVPAASLEDSAAGRAAGASVNGVASSVLRGNGRLRGVVRNAGGTPVSGARVVVWGSSLEASTSASGTFAIQSLPSGSYTVESRAVGYVPFRTTVDIPDGSEGSAEFSMDRYVPRLDTMRVRAYSNPSSFGGFEDRKRSGFGYFLDEKAIEQRGATFMTDLVRYVPGVTIVRGQDGRDVVMLRGSVGSGDCAPVVFVDAIQMLSDDGNLENLVDPQDVRGVEVYTRASNTPAQFQRMNSCGSIVIWTGARRREAPL